ncbi:MAG: molybdopterin biosynthesis protein [Anaerolineaceae bacterium]|nr:molybdopterin biosynthesis protein [Anaerolineaceae bacterium]
MTSIYLHDIPLDEAWKRFEQALTAAGLWSAFVVEEIQLDETACGRVLAEPVWAQLCSPHCHASAMDGFALRSADTAGAIPSSPLTLKLGGQAVYVDTGDPLPEWADAVAPVEQVEAVDECGQPVTDLRNPPAIRLRQALTPWAHVRPMGEDIVASQLVLAGGHRLRPVDLGALAACGQNVVRVCRAPRVGILPTGSELVPVGVAVRRGDVIEYNSLVLAAQVNAWGGQAQRYPITPDDIELLCGQVRAAAQENDLVLINAGSSAGSEDYTARVVERLGELLVHGVAVRPGHPVILGLVRRTPEAGTTTSTVPVIGVPGYPVSAALTGEIFVEPLLRRWLGQPRKRHETVAARLTRKVTSPAGDDDFMRVVVGRVGERLLAAPLARGAGVITSLVRSDGIIVLPRGMQGMEAGTEVRVRLYRRSCELENTIFAIGSHDMTLDLLAQFLAQRERRLVSANVGSLGGLTALQRGEAHFAGAHLLDPESGEYNQSFIRRYLEGTQVRLMVWVSREQGLVLQPGNPKNIRALQDLARPEVRFINRQRGSGTRMLLDYHLNQIGLDAANIQGYPQEEYTHLAVAAAVASGRADCGLAVTAAADALGLEFIPLFKERYDLVIPEQYARDDLLSPLFAVMQDPAFRGAIAALPGYDVSRMGEIVPS